MLFENVDVIIAAQIEREIEETINNSDFTFAETSPKHIKFIL